MPNNKIDKIAHTRLDNHEKLCRIMQRQTHERLRELSRQIERLEKILFTVTGLIIIGLLTLVYDKLL
jgi:hypothetical protein|tara:strand:+ start:787 stop:987 length:201 start_codon:yes stop_codon:yes gene_type:complete